MNTPTHHRALALVVTALATVGVTRSSCTRSPSAATATADAGQGTVLDAGPPVPAVVDPNDSGIEALVALPGIGPALARRIVDERAHGAFRSADDLSRVRGIGPRSIERLRPWFRFGAESIGDASEIYGPTETDDHIEHVR